MANIVIEDKLLKSIAEIAKMKNTTESNIINELLAKGIKEDMLNIEYDCEAFEKDLNEARARINEGESITLEELAKKIGVDLD